MSRLEVTGYGRRMSRWSLHDQENNDVVALGEVRLDIQSRGPPYQWFATVARSCGWNLEIPTHLKAK